MWTYSIITVLSVILVWEIYTSKKEKFVNIYTHPDSRMPVFVVEEIIP